MTEDLSQAERTADEAAWDSWRPETAVPTRREVHQHGFIVGRDYGRERERALERRLREAIAFLEGFVVEWLDDLGADEELKEGLAIRVEFYNLLLTAPGEREGLTAEQIERTQNRSGGISVPIQPDHGPGEPSDAKIERVAKAITMYQTGDPQRIGEFRTIARIAVEASRRPQDLQCTAGDEANVRSDTQPAKGAPALNGPGGSLTRSSKQVGESNG